MIDKIKMYPLGENGLKCLVVGTKQQYYFTDLCFTESDIRYCVQNIKYDNDLLVVDEEIKPILRPLKGFDPSRMDLVSFDGVLRAINKFYDVFGLIEQGKAIAYDPEKHNNCYE